MANLKEQHV